MFSENRDRVFAYFSTLCNRITNYYIVDLTRKKFGESKFFILPHCAHLHLQFHLTHYVWVQVWFLIRSQNLDGIFVKMGTFSLSLLHLFSFSRQILLLLLHRHLKKYRIKKYYYFLWIFRQIIFVFTFCFWATSGSWVIVGIFDAYNNIFGFKLLFIIRTWNCVKLA